MMLKAFKTEIAPSDEQKSLIHQTIGTCRYVYNLYIERNKEVHKSENGFITGYDFSKWLNNEHAKLDEFKWIKNVSSKAVKQSIMNAEKAYKSFFKKVSSFPRFKKKSDYGSFYLIGTIHVERHYIQLPTLGKVKLKEKGYIPSNGIKSCTVTREGDRYFVAALVEVEREPSSINKGTEGLGIDMGIKSFLFTSEGTEVANISKSVTLQKLEKSLKRQSRALSRKVKGSASWVKQKIKVQRLHRRIKNIKTDLKRKLILQIVRRCPSFITVERLNLNGMKRNRRLSNALQQIGIGYFIESLRLKCVEYNIELRQVDRFFPSSQLCSQCGNRKPMPLHVRTYTCDSCDMSIDRDLNAAINLKNAREYTILS